MLETVFDTEEGKVAVIDLMPMKAATSRIIRIVEGRRGRVDMRMVLSLRFAYGNSFPWVTYLTDSNGITATAGPSLVTLSSSVPICGDGCSTTATFSIAAR